MKTPKFITLWGYYRFLLVTTLLLIYTVLILSISLTPLDLDKSGFKILENLSAGLTLAIQSPTITTIVQRLLAFLPLGILLHQALSLKNIPRPRLVASIIIILLALCIELLQASITERHALLSDWVLASLCGIGGVILSRNAEQTQDRLKAILVSLLVLGNIAILWMIGAGHSGAVLSSWNCNNYLLVGNETTENRPWTGQITGLSIYPKNISDVQIHRLSTLPLSTQYAAVRQQLGASSFYDFSKLTSSEFKDDISQKPGANLAISDTRAQSLEIQTDGLHIKQPIIIKSIKPASRLCQSIIDSQALTIEIKLSSSLPPANDVARIVSLSDGERHRNFTLGEDDKKLILRIKTPRTGANGNYLILKSEKKIMAQGLQHLVVRYARGSAAMFVNGKLYAQKNYASQLLSAPKQAVSIAMMAAAIAIVLGAISSALQNYRLHVQTIARSILYASLLPLLYSLLMTSILSHNIDTTIISALLIGPLLGQLLAITLYKLATSRARYKKFKLD